MALYRYQVLLDLPDDKTAQQGLQLMEETLFTHAHEVDMHYAIILGRVDGDVASAAEHFRSEGFALVTGGPDEEQGSE